jgi:hypothetical protein
MGTTAEACTGTGTDVSERRATALNDFVSATIAAAPAVAAPDAIMSVAETQAGHMMDASRRE